MRLIDGDALKENIEWCKKQSPECDSDLWDDLLERIALQPTVDAVPVKHGRLKYYKETDCFSCSECHRYAWDNKFGVMAGHYKYCPQCGAKMDGEPE